MNNIISSLLISAVIGAGAVFSSHINASDDVQSRHFDSSAYAPVNVLASASAHTSAAQHASAASSAGLSFAGIGAATHSFVAGPDIAAATDTDGKTATSSDAKIEPPASPAATSTAAKDASHEDGKKDSEHTITARVKASLSAAHEHDRGDVSGFVHLGF